VSGARRRGGAIGGAGVTRAARRGCSGLTVVLTIAAAAACGGSGGGGAAGTDGAQTAKPAAARPGITVVAERDLGPRLQEWTLRTPALDVETRVRVLLPAGYRAHAERRYPVPTSSTAAAATIATGRATGPPSASPRARR
jgi:hypothetical protein